MNEIFLAVDLTTITIFVINAAIVIVSIFLLFKAIDFSKRAIQMCDPDYRNDWMEKNIHRVSDDYGYWSKDDDGQWTYKND